MNELCDTYIGTPAEIQHKISEFLKEHPDYEVVGRTQQRNFMSLTDTAYITYHKQGTTPLTRDHLCNIVKSVYTNEDDFFDDVEYGSVGNFVVSTEDDDILITDHNSNQFVGWYKFYHLGRALTTNISELNTLEQFIRAFKACERGTENE